MMSEEHTWNILGDHFKRKGFVHHQTESFDQFINVGINKIITEEPEIVLNSKNGKNPGSYTSYKVSFSNVYVPYPTVTEDTRVLRGFLPAEARQRDLTYDAPIYATITETLEIDGKEPETNQYVRVVLGRIPIMLRSSKCYLTNMTPEERIQAGECKHDQGGYFLIRGKERVLVSQLRGIYNIPLVLEQRPGDKYSFICEMRSMSEENGHSVLISAVLGVDDRTLSFSLPYIKDYIPMGVVFKAMGYRADQFSDLIGLSCEKTNKYIRLIINDSFFVEEKEDGYSLFVFENQKKVADSLQVDETSTEGKRRVNDKLKELWKNEIPDVWKHKSTQINAIKYIGQHANHPIKESERKDYGEQVVECEIFPHMGLTSTFKEKAYLLGHMIHKLLATRLGFRKPDDRDNYINKRVESPGILCHELFRQLFKKYIGSIIATIEKKKQLPDVMSIIPRLTDITKGFIHCFGTGNWGVPKNSYVRQGVAQILSRLSYGATLSNLRRVSIPVGKESKNTAIRQINPSQIMYICPVETPEGAPVGIVLNLSLLTRISNRTPTVLVKEVLEICKYMSPISDFNVLNEQTKVFLNGILTGVTEEPNELVEELKEMRRIKMLPWDVSVSYDEVDDEVNICSDEGRLLRPVFKVQDDCIMAKETDGVNWDELVEKGLIVYIDNMEANGSVIAFNQKELLEYKSSYCEISAAMMLGVMASIIPFPDHSQCIFKDEPVYMANGTVKKICDVQVGDEVITFHPETQQQSITKVSHTYTNKTDKQLFEITTLSGRKIIATFDHRFMTFDGWKRIEEIEVGKTLVGVSTEPKPVSNLVDDYVILTKKQFIEKCLDAQIEEFFAIKYASELSFPIKSTHTNLYIVSRLFGFICTESCYISFLDKDDVRLNVLFTDKDSANLFNEDIERLGFKYSKKEVVDFHCTEYSGAISALFIALGCNNIIQEEECKYKRLPDWIKNGSDLVKREFLSGFQGGCGSEIKHILTNKIIMGVTSKSIKTEHVDSLMNFMNDIVELLRYFNIETNNITCEKYKDIMDVSYYISSTPNNLIKYFDIVGYRYNVDKNRESGIYVEYLKYLEKKYIERFHLDKEIKSYTDTIPLDVKNGNKIKKLHSDKIKLQKGLFSPEEWRNIIKWKSTTLFIPLESKIESLETIISDITTESTNQSFLCGDTFCVHNSPRNCYQCLDPETLVVMADNTKKAIKDIKIGDSVISVDPITCVQSTTTVTNQYVRETDKEIITIETESGRKITCTTDHPVLTTDGWKHAIDAENICVIPQQVVYSGGDEDLYITLPETSVKEKHINDLTSIGLYPIKSTSLPILARIVGYLITNGSTSLYDKRAQVKFNFYSIEDCEDFLKDLHELGFSSNKLIDVDKIIDVIFEKYGKCKQIIYNNAFASLLIGLVDGYVGKRTTQSHPPLMNWIKNGSMLVKREFLSGFQGGNKLTGVTSTKFLFNHTSLSSRVDYANSLVEFMKEMKGLFEEFDIECSGPFLIKKSQHSQSNDVHLYFKNTPDNHINYFEKIGWRYNIFKYAETLRVYEYQKTCQKEIDDIIVERQIIKKYIEDSMTIRQISDKLNKTYQYISDSVRSIEENRDPRIPNSFESWKRQVRDRAIFVKIVKKTRLVNKVNGNMIADITTESENHSFIAGDSFCVHNSSMGKQAMSMFALSHLIRADTVVHVLNNPHRPLVGTKAAEMMGFNEMPSGVNCIVAIACYTGFNQEDSVMLNHSAVQRGLFWATTYKTHVDEEKKQGYNSEKIGIPPLNVRKHDANYGLLDKNGIVRLRHSKWIDEKGQTKGGGALFVQKGDVIIGKTSIQSDKSGNEIMTDCSLIIGKGEEGYIDRIFISTTPNGYKLVKIVIRCLRIPEVGDKFASRAAQKGTVGMVYKQEDMPFTKDGISPDIIINPHCLAQDHEILTEHGFMNWKEAKEGYDKGTLRIAGYNHNTGCLVYEYPTHFILNESKTQEMIEFTHTLNKVSLLVTLDHDMFAKCGKMNNNLSFWNEKQNGYKKIKAHELLSSDLIKFTGKAQAGIKGSISFLNSLLLDTREKVIAFCELYGYWLGNRGYLGFCGKSIEITSIKISDDEWLRKRFNILDLILCTDYNYNTSRSSITNKNWRSCWSIINKNWIDTFFGNYTNNYKKLMAPWVWNLPSIFARCILDGLCYIDGTKKAYCNIILTECAEFRDEIMRLALHGGYSSHFKIKNQEPHNKDIWIISYTNTNVVSEPVLNSYTDVKKIDYTGLTWCVTMPSGFIITRRANRNKENIVVKASRPIITGQCIPSRMTINQLIESVIGKSSVINGKYGDATPFTDESKNIAEEACKALGMHGYESTGKEMLMNGMTGESMGMFFIGPVYYQRLKHLVSDKMHARASGPITTLTRQPLEGRSRDGGQRFGEMERDCHDYHAPIPLNCGLSVEIGTMENKNYYVLSYDEQKQQIIPSTQSNFLSKGNRKCVDVIFQDGRSIRCTDNHKILTSDNIWIPVSEMVKEVTQIKTGITNPLIIVKEEIENFESWKFQAGYTKIEVKDEESYFRALSFARLIGYICADGGIYQINKSKKYIGLINLGHEIDLSSALEDLGKFAIITQGNFRQKNHYRIDIPQNFVTDLMKVEGILVGKKINQPAQLPTFITDPSCPLPIVREFLGGLFGGDGHTCVLGLHRGKRDLLTSVSFSKSKSGSQLDSLEEMMKQLQILLARFDIHNVTIQKAKETTSSKKKVDSVQENKSYQLTLHLCIDELPRFHEKIGFRYCCHKSQRLEAGASYKRLRDGVTRQHNWIVERVDEITQFSKIKKEFPNKIVPTKKAIERAVKELIEKEALLHEYAIPSTHDINDHLVKGTKFGNFRGKGFPNAEEYLKDIGALDWFLQDEPVKPEIDESPPCDNTEEYTNLNVSYGVNRKYEGLPTMNLRVIDIRPAGVHPVYDIQVDDTHTFLANGIVAHNCMIGHGVSKFLQERLFLVSDKYQVSICNKCGNFATSKTECQSCETDQISLVKLPYVGKLVIQELNAMMIKTKITAK
jgi:DNA-directed RNA polymerase beta subunit/intein/homing endonuclease